MEKISIRWFVKADLPAIGKMEESLPKEYRWSDEDYHNQLLVENSVCFVAYRPAGYEVIGLLVCSLCETHVEIVRLLVNPQNRREGVGRTLVERAIDRMNTSRRFRVCASVSVGDIPLQELFLRCKFAAIREDAEWRDEQFYLPPSFRFVYTRDVDPGKINRSLEWGELNTGLPF